MADNIEGLPEGAVVGPELQAKEQVEGLPEGAVVGPALSAPKQPASSHPVVSAVVDTLMNKPGGKQAGQEGMWSSFGHGMGIPTSKAEAEEGVPKLTPGGLAEIAMGPAGQAAKMIYGTAQAGTKGREEGAQEIKEAGQNILAGQPIMRNLGKAGYGALHGILQSIPFAGAPAETAGEQVAAGNVPGAIGSGAASAVQSLGLLKGYEAEGHDPADVQRLKILKDSLDKAKKDAVAPAAAYDAYESSRQKGEPAPPEVIKKNKTAIEKVEEAQRHYDNHAEAMAAKAAARKTAAPQAEKPITAEDVEGARPEAPAPTDEELKARQEKLMGQMEEKAGIEKPAPVAENVKVPGQVQPETFPQEPTEAPRVDETTRMRPLGGDKGVLVGRKPLQLGEGTSEAAPAAPEAPKAPLGEILPPEKSATAAEMAGLKAIGGQVVEAPEKAVGPLIKQGLAEGSKAAKPKATPTEAAPVEASKPVEEKVERSPEDETKLDRVLFQLTNQEQLRLGTEHGVNEAEHNLSEKSKDEHRLPVGKKAHVEATKTAMPEGLKDAIVSAANDWDNKNTQVFDPASMSSAHGAERSRAILKEAQRRFNLEQEKGAEEIAAGAEKGKSYGKSNKFVTKEEADTAVKSLNEKLTRSNAGFDPTAIADAVKIGAYHFEAGLREFGVWSKQMTQDLGDKIKPHLDAMWKTMQGGGEYKGVQEGVPEANLKGLVLFDHPETGSTLALPEDQVTPEAVKEKLTAHKEAWDKAKNGAKRAFERVEKARGKGTIPASKTGPLKFGEPEFDEATSFEPIKFSSEETPKQLAKGASGESAASLEEISRMKSEKRTGIKYYRIDSRSGNEVPIIGAGALDAVAGPYEHIVRRGPDGEVVLDSGKKARPLGVIKRK